MLAAALLVLLASSAHAQVTATGPNGPTNPSAPSFAAVGSSINSGSMARLLSLNGVDDFCLYAPATYGDTIGNLEAEVVAYCTKPRNNARIIPDGTIQSAHFIKTPLYVQIYGLWDGTKVNIRSGDFGGELDPHGATGEGNPVGGNVTSNINGQNVFYEEWMQYVAADQFCFRICTAQNATVSAAQQCQHEIDLLGCSWVMAIPDLYNADHAFTSCDGDAAYPPGIYPLANGSTSTFAQRYTGEYTQSSSVKFFTVGVTVTPSAPYSYPATSNCVAYPTISNGVVNNVVQVAPSTITGGSAYAAVAPSQPVFNNTVSTPTTTPTMSSTGSGASTTAAASRTSGSASASSSGAAARGQSITWGFMAVLGLGAAIAV